MISFAWNKTDNCNPKASVDTNLTNTHDLKPVLKDQEHGIIIADIFGQNNLHESDSSNKLPIVCRVCT